jgi:hypothetical protein
VSTDRTAEERREEQQAQRPCPREKEQRGAQRFEYRDQRKLAAGEAGRRHLRNHSWHMRDF